MRVRFCTWILTAAAFVGCSAAPMPSPSASGGGGAGAGTGGQPESGTGGAVGGGADASVTPPDGSSSGAGSPRVLIHTLATGCVHDSTPVAADFISRSAKVAGLMPEISKDPSKFTTAGLAPYGAIVLVATSGEPFGPGTTGVDALVAWLKGGGALVGIENATHAYATNPNYVSLLGGEFAGHPTGYLTTTCVKEGTHPSVAMLPAMFNVTDEIYAFTQFRMDNQIVLRCDADRRPVSWYREEGAGRVFFTALGHSNASWQQPPLVDQHVIPGLLWAMRR
jgi:type 1 glutamine amidotransferase